ncbi:MAG: hypothetical protein KDI13_05540 [Alphaproteobacteria bacterium]|nr:hypothetical protein [Alphaproteobacteria bacterium]
MTAQTDKASRIMPLLIWAVALAAISPWLFIQLQAMIAGNVSSLLIGTERLLHGVPYLEADYETNPPLSMLIYAPHILLAQILGISLPLGATITTFILVALSSLTVREILKPFPMLDQNEKRNLLFCYILGITVLSSTIFFPDRENLITMGLFPFILCQYALTQKIQIKSTLLYPVLIIGALCVLVKPHFGLIPTILLIHRMISQKRFSAVKDPDFIILAVATLSYVTLLLTIFREYIDIVLPDALDLYVHQHNVPDTITYTQPRLMLCVFLLLTETLSKDLEKSKKRLVIFFYLCCLIAIIPAIVQMKGYFNHLIPATTFLAAGAGMSLYFRLKQYIKRPIAYLLLFPLILFGGSQLIQRPSWKFPKHSEIPNLPLSAFLKKECPAPCTFFMFHHDIEIMPPTAAYMGYTPATRFATLWFIPQIYGQLELMNDGENVPLTRDRLENLKTKYTLFAAQDLEKYEPSLLLIGTNVEIFKNENFDFMKFFMTNPTYKEIIEKNYEKTGTFTMDRAEYFKGTTMNQSYMLKYDVYKRKSGPWLETSVPEYKKP